MQKNDCDKQSDENLVNLTLKDQDYFNYIIERYENKLSRYIKRIAGLNQQDTEDLLQDIFIKVYQNLNAFDSSLKFSSWIYRIAHNEVISHWRKNKARPQFVGGEEIEGFLHNIDSGLNIHQDVENKNLRDDIEKILAELDLKYREVLILKFIEEKSYKEISDIIKKPSGTVATLISRAKKQFKREAGKMAVKFN